MKRLLIIRRNHQNGRSRIFGQQEEKRYCIYALTGILTLLAFPASCYAYLDPGAGSYIIQGIIAGFVAVSFAVKVYWEKLKKFFQSSSRHHRSVDMGNGKKSEKI